MNKAVSESNVRRMYERIKNNPIDLSFTPKNMYFWGFLWADGYIQPNKNRISLEIITKDMNDIKLIIPNCFSYYNRKPRGNRQDQCQALAIRKDYVEFLYSNGYENKQLPSDKIINHKYYYYWIRGLIDGDGCWYYHPKNNTRQFFVASNYNQDWSFLVDKLTNIGCESHKILRKTQKDNTQKYSIVRTCKKNDIKKIYNFLYPNGFDFGLKRKHDKAYTMIS